MSYYLLIDDVKGRSFKGTVALGPSIEAWEGVARLVYKTAAGQKKSKLCSLLPTTFSKAHDRN